MTKKKILIIGNGANAYALAKKLSTEHDIYVTPSSDTLAEIATTIDIREGNINELLEFVMENGIDLTIPLSQIAIENNIVQKFTDNNQYIFGPLSKAAELCFNKAAAKKILYKLHIPTAKFGILEKQNMAVEYLKNQKIPFVVKTNDKNSAIILTSVQQGKKYIESLPFEKNSRVIIEDYIYGTSFSFYTVTDGYKALPIGSSIVYRHSLEGDGGQLTSGMGAISPNYKLSTEQEYYLMDNVIYPLLEYLQAGGNAYLGILGVKGIITDEGSLVILGWQSFMQDSDSAAIIENIDEDLYSLFESCVIGSFSDEKEIINQKENYSVSVVLRNNNSSNEENIITGLDNLEEDTIITFYPNVKKNKYLEYEASKDSVVVVTSSASSISRAGEKVYSEIKDIDFKGMYYRKDICPKESELLFS